jgi:chaperonin groL
MAKQVFYGDEAREKVLAGAKTLADAVKTTMGPKGRNVVISKSYGGPNVTHDGVTVAEAIDLPENEDNLGEKVGAELIKQAAKKMNKAAGDGTTTVTVLTYEILKEANRLIAAGHNPMELRKGVEKAGAQVLSELNKIAEPVDGKNDLITEVASISAGDTEIGKLIASVISRIGKDGVVSVEAGQGLAMESEITEGFTFDRGYVSAYMATDTNRMEAVYDKPAIIITDKKISSAQEMLPLMEKLVASGKKDIVLIAEDVEGEALGILILNRLKGALNTVAVKAPSFGDRRKEVLQDIATLTGASVITSDQGMTFDNVGLEVVGSARKVIVAKDNTTIIEGAGDKTTISQRIDQIKTQAGVATSDYDREQLDKRAAALSGKVAVIKVGGATETEIDEKKYRVDDAVAAVKAALLEGIVPGGGVTPINLAGKITGDSAGAEIVRNALLMPFKQLATNAGLNAEALLAQVQEAKPSYGVDVANYQGKLIDLKKAGVVDPAMVTYQAIQNAVSIASTAMTMGALVVDIPEKPTAEAAGNPGMGMGY